MTNVRMLAAKVVLSMVLAGSLATAASGVASAAQGTGGHHLRHATGTERARMCQREQGRLALAARRQAKFATGTAAFAGLEAKAAGRGDAKLAAYWAKVVSHRQASAARHQTRLAARTARDARAHGLVGGKCA